MKLQLFLYFSLAVLLPFPFFVFPQPTWLPASAAMAVLSLAGLFLERRCRPIPHMILFCLFSFSSGSVFSACGMSVSAPACAAMFLLAAFLLDILGIADKSKALGALALAGLVIDIDFAREYAAWLAAAYVAAVFAPSFLFCACLARLKECGQPDGESALQRTALLARAVCADFVKKPFKD